MVSVIGQVIFRFSVNDFDELIRKKAKEKVKAQWPKEIEHPGAMNAMQLEVREPYTICNSAYH